MAQKIVENSNDHQNLSQPLTVSEFWCFVGCMIFIGMMRPPDIADIWGETFKIAFVAERFSRFRFTELLASFHVSEYFYANEKAKLRAADPLWTLRWFLDELNDNFLAAVTVGSLLCIDESMVASKHHTSIQQYLKDKPTKRGIKFFVLCCLLIRFGRRYSYCLNALAYCGKKGPQLSVPGYEDLGATANVVLKLIQPHINYWRSVSTDRYYTSIPLFRALYNLKVMANGTIQKNRKGFPEEFKVFTKNNLKKDSSKNLPQGYFLYYFYFKMCLGTSFVMRNEATPYLHAIWWMDRKPVTFLDTSGNNNRSDYCYRTDPDNYKKVTVQYLFQKVFI